MLPAATVTCEKMHVVVVGPRGKLERTFNHANLEMIMVTDKKLRVDSWFANRKVCAGFR
jgi:ribosomal protein L6P/L9E